MSYDDILDVYNDIIERFEELDDTEERDEDEEQEYADLGALLGELRNEGGDVKWHGHWYPGLLIRGDYFETYARGFAEDIGAINSDTAWPATCIDWKKAAKELQTDYTGIEFDGDMWWYR